MQQTLHLEVVVTVMCGDKISRSSHLTIKTEVKFKQKAEANVLYDTAENVL